MMYFSEFQSYEDVLETGKELVVTVVTNDKTYTSSAIPIASAQHVVGIVESVVAGELDGWIQWDRVAREIVGVPRSSIVAIKVTIR